MSDLVSARRAWQERAKMFLRQADFASVLLVLADNYEHRGDITAMIEDFCAEHDPRD